MEYNLGDIYWLNSQEKILHPHVIIGKKDSNGLLTAAALTTNMSKRNMPGNVLLDAKEGNLERQSIVEVSKVIKVSESDLGKYIGTLSVQRVKDIIAGIGFLERTYFNK